MVLFRPLRSVGSGQPPANSSRGFLMLTLTFLGGAGTVTGSKHLLEFDGRRLLIDCGLFQGTRSLRELNWAEFPVDPRSIDAIILTHAHLDHSGYLPKLVREGFRGQIYSSHATRDIAEIILKDSGFLQERDAEYANRKGFSRHTPASPLYTVGDAERTLDYFSPIGVHAPARLPGGAILTLRRAGHILGATTAEIAWGGHKVVFSGDLGRYDDAVMVDPDEVHDADYIVIESTYGDRRHQRRSPVEALGEIIERTTGRGGTVVIPAFAVGRIQSLLYYLWRLKEGGRILNVPVYLDSPMAINASALLCAHQGDHRLSPEVCEGACGVATYVREVEASKELSASPMPKVIISASGMATGGRVLHHLKAFAPHRRNTVLFSGYQAVGTRGRAMVDGAREVKIHGDWYPVCAEIADLPMLSAHADADELLRWLGGFRSAPRRIHVVHGEPPASEALSVRIAGELGWDSHVPQQGEAVIL
jgi:metallo-beta-lactamase family protein